MCGKIRKGEITYENKLVDHEIASQRGVSRMPARETLLQLKNEGFLQGTSRGFILRCLNPTEISNISETRLLLEPAAASAACKNSSLKGLGKMHAVISAAEQAYEAEDIVEYMDSLETFRSIWVSIIPNSHLIETSVRLSDQAETVRLATLREKGNRELSLRSTQSVLEAFLLSDAEAVKEKVAYNMRVSAACYYAKQEAIFDSHGARTSESFSKMLVELKKILLCQITLSIRLNNFYLKRNRYIQYFWPVIYRC